MVLLKYPLMLLVMFPVLATNGLKLAHINQLKWQNRIIILHNPVDIERSLEQLESNKSSIESRDVVWFILTEKRIHTNYSGSVSDQLNTNLKSRYLLQNNQAILIGKDGGLKANSMGLSLLAFFNDIDAMPMRKNEIIQRNNPSK